MNGEFCASSNIRRAISIVRIPRGKQLTLFSC
jgi:hypothetical protein